jgi:disulfide bond formation protein DsbB
MNPVVTFVINILSLGTIAADIFVIFLFAIILTPLSERGWGKKVGDFIGRRAMVLSFLLTVVGVAGSLFWSEYAHFAACELCWIQRGLLYTQAVILFLALFARKEEHVRKFQNLTQKACLVLSAIGFPIAAYNMYLQFGGGAIVPCSAIGPTCSYVYFLTYGYITIPTMSLTAFALILCFMLLHRPAEEK